MAYTKFDISLQDMEERLMAEHQSGILSDVNTDEVEAVKLAETVEEGLQQPAPVKEEIKDVDKPSEPEPIAPDLDNEDWMSKLREDEVFNGPDGPAPRLHGLRRLAKPFIMREESRVNHLIVVPRQIVRTLQTFNSGGDLMSTNEEIGHHHFPMASVTFFITDVRGRTFSDSADAFYSNCEELGLFPTAVASARAEARTLRKMLSISRHAAEELTQKDASEELAPEDDSPVKPEQAKLIDKMLASLDEYTLKDLLDNITTREIFTVEELTVGEARKALRILNDQKKKGKKKGGKK